MLVNWIIDMQKSPKCSFALTTKIVWRRMQHCFPTSCKIPTLVKQCSWSLTAGKKHKPVPKHQKGSANTSSAFRRSSNQSFSRHFNADFATTAWDWSSFLLVCLPLTENIIRASASQWRYAGWEQNFSWASMTDCPDTQTLFSLCNVFSSRRNSEGC